MGLIETSLHVSYQEGTWTLLDAVREIISNAFDGERRFAASGRGRMSLDYSPKTKVMKVTNAGVVVPAKALLMGESEARNEKSAIGQFGEGLPMALLVLARRGMDVVILNGEEKWEPCIVTSETYKSRVLAVKTRQMLKYRDEFTVEMHGIEPEEYEEARNLFLALDPTFRKDEAVPAGAGGEQILLNPAFRGRVYNKGVYVCSNGGLMYGYDLNTKLNRDRSFIRDYDLEDATSRALQYAADSDEVFREVFLRSILDEVTAFEGGNQYGSLYYSDKFPAALAGEFTRRFGASAIPVANVEQIREAEFFGHVGVIVSDLARQLITKGGVTPLHDITRTGRLEAAHVWQPADLPAESVKHFDKAVAVLRVALPLWEPNVRIVTFRGEGILGTYREADRRIDISHEVLGDFQRTLTTLVHEVAHCLGKDGTLAHGEGQVTIFARIVDVLLHGPAA